jgi:hypothetical protein
MASPRLRSPHCRSLIAYVEEARTDAIGEPLGDRWATRRGAEAAADRELRSGTASYDRRSAWELGATVTATLVTDAETSDRPSSVARLRPATFGL